MALTRVLERYGWYQTSSLPNQFERLRDVYHYSDGFPISENDYLLLDSQGCLRRRESTTPKSYPSNMAGTAFNNLHVTSIKQFMPYDPGFYFERAKNLFEDGKNIASWGTAFLKKGLESFIER